ncbi:unnamed protein product [Protopolystoma xenopodis]|uniref:Carbonic anhydrase n=1 Tax=Protopolystoma xenopodis TaxID=117903 RepID=A0A3S5B664_9PLAT|nr:unnamed protein product [Protopolystoma xenopodis]
MSYGYGPVDGPHTWSKKFEHAGGSHQSPINIATSDVQRDPTLKALKCDFKGITENLLIVKEHNFQISIHGIASMTGGPLSSSYRLAQFHFHWGSDDHWGSEHLVDGRSFSAELHLVFFNEKYSSFQAAIENKDGISVLGVFLQVIYANYLVKMFYFIRLSKP